MVLKKKVFLSGNNQILSFGMFMKRSYPKYSIKGSSGENLLEISSHTPYQIPSARYDPKFLEVCYLPDDNFKSYQCVLNDGVKDTPGSTLNWVGEENGEITAFNRTSESKLYFIGTIYTLLPCYVTDYNPITDETHYLQISYANNTITWVNNSEEIFTNCSKIWITPGSVIRSKCLSVMNNQYSSRDSFMAAILGQTSVTALYDLHFYCTTLLTYTIPQLEKIYFQSKDTIRAHITLPNNDRLFGNFISSSDEFIFLGEGITLSRLLQFHDFIDKNTRSFNIYIVVRNLGDHELFYSLITLEFQIDSTGYLQPSYSTIFIPIVQYSRSILFILLFDEINFDDCC